MDDNRGNISLQYGVVPAKKKGSALVMLPALLLDLYLVRRTEIQSRLADFAAVTPNQWFYELCYCLLTPQSKASHADAVVSQLQQISFHVNPVNVSNLLANPAHYIRFHNVKTGRLLRAQAIWPTLVPTITQAFLSPLPSLNHDLAVNTRNSLAEVVDGFGMKEASHFLRNIGVRGLTILDRHILNCMVDCGIVGEIPIVQSKKKYLEVEEKLLDFCVKVGVSVDEIDLLFWCSKAGEIRK